MKSLTPEGPGSLGKSSFRCPHPKQWRAPTLFSRWGKKDTSWELVSFDNHNFRTSVDLAISRPSCYICLIESLSCLSTYLRKFFLSPHMAELLSHPISMGKLKQLEGNFQRLCWPPHLSFVASSLSLWRSCPHSCSHPCGEEPRQGPRNVPLSPPHKWLPQIISTGKQTRCYFSHFLKKSREGARLTKIIIKN